MSLATNLSPEHVVPPAPASLPAFRELLSLISERRMLLRVVNPDSVPVIRDEGICGWLREDRDRLTLHLLDGQDPAESLAATRLMLDRLDTGGLR